MANQKISEARDPAAGPWADHRSRRVLGGLALRDSTARDSVHALPAALAGGRRPIALDPTEAENVRIYKQASPAVANIVTRAVEYDFFYNAVPVEGAGSGFVIDTDGHILTNYHVVQGAQTIEVTLGDQTRYKAKYIGADTRNDIALIQIDPKGRKLAHAAAGRFAQSAGGPARAGDRKSVRLSKHADDRRGELAGPHGADRREHVHRRSDSDRCGD